MEANLMTPEDLARFLGVPKQTIYGWRTRGRGPRGVRVGKHLRYRPADVEIWLDSIHKAPLRGEAV